MWKKVLIFIMGLVGTFSVVYAYQNIPILADANTINTGNMTGRVNIAPLGISGSNIGMQKGDKFFLSAPIPETTKNLGWQLLGNEFGTNKYVAMTTELIGKAKLAEIDINKTPEDNGYQICDNYTPISNIKCKNYNNDPNPAIGSQTARLIYSLNQSFSANDRLVIGERTKTRYQNMYNSAPTSYSWIRGIIKTIIDYDDEFGKNAFMPLLYDLWKESTYMPTTQEALLQDLSARHLTFSDAYGMMYLYWSSGSPSMPYFNSYIDSNGIAGTYSTYKQYDEMGVRPAIITNLDQVVFGVSLPQPNGDSNKVEEPYLQSDFTSMYANTLKYEEMKLRVLSSSYSASIQKLVLDNLSEVDKNDENIYKVQKDGVIYIDAITQGGNAVSALLFDSSNHFVHYFGNLPVVNGKYKLDLGSVSTGSYKLSIVSEDYDTTTVEPAFSSNLSDTISINIVESHIITYVKSPDIGASIGKDYEYLKNVGVGNKIGTISVSQSSVLPLTYELSSYKDQSYKNFEIDDLDINGSSNSTTLNIKVKTNAPDLVNGSLKSGEYNFCIISKDANGYPENPIDGKTKVCESFVVEKTLATVSFKTKTQTRIKIGDTVGIDEFIETNNDELTLTGGSYPPTYNLSGGVDGTGITVTEDSTDPTKYHIGIGATTSATLPTTFKLKATLPETDNFETVTSSEKEIYVFKGLSKLTWTLTKTGSYAISDVTSGKTVGTLLASDGLSDYTYSLTKAGDDGYDGTKAKDNSKFTIDGTALATGIKADVKTNTTLGSGTYHIQMKVIDDVNDVKVIDATIEVSANAQAALNFKEDSKDITTKTIYYDDQNITVQAEGGENSITSLPTYTYSDEADKSYFTIKDNGNGTATLTPVKITETGKTVKVKATKAGNASFAEVSTELEITIQPAKQTVSFDNTDNPRKIKLDETGVKETASGFLTSNGTKGSGVGGITYSSAEESIASIDPTTGEITPHKNGTVAITATLNKAGTDDYNDNYETATATKNIYIYEGMAITWKPVTPKLKASGTASAGAKAGSITVSNNTGSVTYAPVSDTSIAENIDGGLFEVDALGNVKLANDITASEFHTHGNPYKIQATVKDDNGTQTINIKITIDPADNDFYFVDPDDMSKLNKIKKTFSDTTFQLATKNSNGGTVTYKLKDGQDESIIEVNPDGTITMLKTGGPVMVEATVTAGSGYAGKTIEIPITITKATYAIAWQKPNTTYVKYTKDVSVEEKAILTPTGALAYESLTKDICDIDVNGTVTALKEGTCEIKAKSTNSNYEEVTTTKQVIFFTGAQGTFTQTNIPQAGSAPVNTTIGTTQIIGLDDTSDYKYSINPESTNKNTDSALFQVSEDYGTVSLKQAITAETLKMKTYDENKGGYPLLVQVTAKNDITGDQAVIDCVVIIKGAKMSDVSFKDDEGKATTKISKVYQKNGTFTVDLLNNKGGTPKYSFKSGPEDVIDKEITGNMISILHANEKTNLTNVVIQAEIPAKNGYEPTIVTCVVVITQAEQENFKFKDAKIQMLPNSKIEAELEGQETPGPTTLKSDDKSIVTIDNDKVTLVSKEKEATTTITATHKGDRDYKDGIATVQVEVTNTPAYPFAIDVSDATYGDEPYLAEVTQSSPTDGAELGRTWSSSDESVATIDPLTGEITVIGAGSATITCIQTSSIDPDIRDSVVLNVSPKPIELIIDNQEKYVGEAVPKFTVQIPTEDLVGGDTLTDPTFTCVDPSGNTVNEMTGKGTYDILGSYPKNAYPNYDITIVKGTLIVHQDDSGEAWYELKGKATGNSIPTNTWVNESVYVSLKKTESDPYDQISLNQSNWDNEHILVETEGITTSNVYFQNSDTKAQATNQSTTIKIDHTKPEITSITGEPIEQSAISKLLEVLTFGHYFKPQDEITIQAKDIQPSGVKEISGLKEVNYRIYPINKQTGLPETEVYDEGTVTVNMETIKFKVEDIGIYRICATAIDQAGNASTTKCSDINVKEIDVDKDGDGIPDMNDSDNDGCPDLNIVLGTDKEGHKIKLNVAEKDKKYPYMNIDSNGDGKADLNVDTDFDKKPDLNLVILTEKDWKPKTCVIVDKLTEYSDPVEYCTGTDAKASINVDMTVDRVPDINIDTNGDMKADLNITKDGDINPYLNIATIESWKPDQDYIYKGFAYDTIHHKPYLNIDSDHDGLPDLNVDLDDDGIADINIDIDGDGIPDVDIDTIGDGKPDLNIDNNHDGEPDEHIYKLTEWKPEKNYEVNGISYDTIEIVVNNELEDNGIVVEKPDGTFLPNFAIKVHDITDTKKEEVEKEASNLIDETQEVKSVFDVKLLENDVEVQPDGALKVRIPLPEGITNPKLLVKRSNGTYETITAKEEHGYLVYETNELGTVTIIGDKSKQVDEPDPEPTPNPKDPQPSVEEPKQDDPISKPSVQGTYISKGVGGANTGDSSNVMLYLTFFFTSLGILTFVLYKKNEQ